VGALFEVCLVLSGVMFAVLGVALVVLSAMYIFMRPSFMLAASALAMLAAWKLFHADGPLLMLLFVFSVIAVGASFSELAKQRASEAALRAKWASAS
jgi:NADH:ubiquinone oxidoreductase subunit K